jgi:hypothetical protein
MLINKENGHLILAPDVELSPKSNLDKVSKLKLGEIQELDDLENGYASFTLKNVKVADHYFIFEFSFRHKKLKSIDFIVDKKKFDLKESWGSWNEKKEKALVSKFKKWILEEVGREGKFSWGRIHAAYDARGGSSSIVISYE